MHMLGIQLALNQNHNHIQISVLFHLNDT